MIDFGANIFSSFSDKQNMKESCLILEKLLNLGFDEVLCTKKFFIEKTSPIPTKEKIELKNQTKNLPLKLHFADEIFLSKNLKTALENEKIYPLNKKYLLLKLPERGKVPPEKVKKILIDIQKNSLTPILVNPEKCEFLQENPKIFNDFAEIGTMFQYSFKTMVGMNGREAEKLMKFMLGKNLVDFLGTNASSSDDEIFQKFNKSKKKIERIIGKQGLEKIFRNAKGVL